MSTGHSDPLVRFVEETVGDVFSSGPRTGRTGDERPRRSTGLVALSLPVGVAAVAALFAERLSTAVPAGAGPLQDLLITLGEWRILLVAAAIAAAVFDLMRFFAAGNRTAVRNQITKTTAQQPTSVRVTMLPGRAPAPLWWSALRTPRRAVVRFERGTVMDSGRLTSLRAAVKEAAGRSWDMQVSWDAPRDRIVITRTPITEVARQTGNGRSPNHRKLETALARSPLRDARIETITSKTAEQPEEREIGYRVDFAPSLATGRRSVQNEIENALRGLLGTHPSGRLWKFTWQLDHDPTDLSRDGDSARLLVELQADLPRFVVHRAPTDLDSQTEHERLHVPFGEGVGEKIAVWNISWKSNAPHILIIGPTGGGKTSAIRTLVTGLVLRGICVLAIDPKKIELDGMENWPGVTAVVYTLRHICALISAVHSEMHARLDWVHATKMPNTTLPIFAIILDEFFVMSGMINRATKGPDKALADWVKGEDPLGKIADIAALIRSAGGREAVGVQRPDAFMFGDAGGSVRDNFGTRVSLARLSQDGDQMMWGESNVTRDVDTSVPGRAMASNERGDPFEAQIFWTPDVDDHPNKWSRLSEDDRTIIEGLRPEVEPVFVAYSHEMRDFLKRLGRPYKSPDPVAGEDPKKPAQMRARDLSLGDRLHHVDDDGVTKVTGIVSKVRVTDTHVYVDLVSDSRPRWQAEYRLDELVDADQLGTDENPSSTPE